MKKGQALLFVVLLAVAALLTANLFKPGSAFAQPFGMEALGIMGEGYAARLAGDTTTYVDDLSTSAETFSFPTKTAATSRSWWEIKAIGNSVYWRCGDSSLSAATTSKTGFQDILMSGQSTGRFRPGTDWTKCSFIAPTATGWIVFKRYDVAD